MKSNREGLLYFAFNNQKINYVKLAFISALTAKHHLNRPVCLITTQHDYEVFLSDLDGHADLIEKTFDHVRFINIDKMECNNKIYNNGKSESFNLTYKNRMQTHCYDYSPFESTIVLDSDYLVMSDQLNSVWDSAYDFAANYKCMEIGLDDTYVQQTYGNNMQTLWSTVMFFRKTPWCDVFFGLVAFIREHWRYYYNLYGIRSSFYRNDYVMGIAHHIINGYRSASTVAPISNMGISILLDRSHIVDMPEKDRLILLIDDTEKNPTLMSWSSMDIHIQNKWAMSNLYEKVIQFYE